MLSLLTDASAWASFLTLTALEIVLGIDNVIFLAITAGRLPPEKRALARRLGLAMALGLRVVLLLSLAWLVGLATPVFSVMGHAVSWRDMVLLGGGLFLIVKATIEVHHSVEGHQDGDDGRGVVAASFAAVIAQIALLDLVFSLDSIITAIGMADHLPVMIAAVVAAIFVMLAAADAVSRFIEKHPTVKMLALSFLLLVGMALVADGLHFHVPRGYVYFAIAFSALVEGLNLLAARRKPLP